MLTTGADWAAATPPDALNAPNFDNVFTLTANNDTIGATQATLNTGDAIIDSSTTDNDTLNIATTANISATNVATVRNIENINVEVSRVGAFTFEADNITHDTGNQTFTFNRNDLFDGAVNGAGSVTVNDATAGTYVAGTKVTTFTVAFAENDEIAAVVDGRAATGAIAVTGIDEAGVTVMAAADQDVSVTGGADSVATVMTSGEAAITNAVDALTIAFQGASDTTLDAIGADGVTLTGSADVALNVAAATLDGATLVNNVNGTVNVVVGTAASMNLEDVGAVTSIELADDFGLATAVIEVNAGQLITTAVNQTTNLLTIENTAATTTGGTRFAVLDNEDDAAVAITNIAFTGFEAVSIDATADELEITDVDFGDADVTLSGDKDINLGTVAAAASIVSASTANITLVSEGNAAGEQTIVTGAGDDDVEVDDTTTTFVVNLGAGANVLTITGAATDSQFVMGAGADTVTIANTVFGDVIVVTGAGDDELTLDNAGTHQINLGTGANTLTLTENADGTDATLALGTGANTIVLASDGSTDVDLTGATISGNVAAINLTSADALVITSAQLASFGSFTLEGVANSTLNIEGTATANTINTSVITPVFGSSAEIVIQGAGGNDTITLGQNIEVVAFEATAVGNGNDTITGFTAGNVTTADVLDFTAFLGASANSLVTVAGALANTDVAFVRNDAFFAMSATDLQAALTASTWETATDATAANVILVSAASGNVVKAYYVAGTADDAFGALTLVGTITMNNAGLLDAANLA